MRVLPRSEVAAVVASPRGLPSGVINRDDGWFLGLIILFLGDIVDVL